MLAALRQLLSRAKHLIVVGEAENGLEAVRVVGELLPDLVIMDLQMPVMDGLTATAEIKRLYPNTRVLIWSFQEGAGYSEQSLKAGADGYITKSADPDKLYAAISGACERVSKSA
jgi:DNA-binding NarL/FixJ family response regulator